MLASEGTQMSMAETISQIILARSPGLVFKDARSGAERGKNHSGGTSSAEPCQTILHTFPCRCLRPGELQVSAQLPLLYASCAWIHVLFPEPCVINGNTRI